MKKLWPIAVLILTLGVVTKPVMAQEPLQNPDKLVDEARVLTAVEFGRLKDRAAEISEKYKMDVAVVTKTNLAGKTAQEAADEIYDGSGYGRGEGKDGILLMVDMGSREWAISTHGTAIDLFTDYRLTQISDRMLVYLGEEKYYDAFDTYLQDVEFYMAEGSKQTGGASSSVPADSQSASNESRDSEAVLPPAGTAEQIEQPQQEKKKVNPLKNMIYMSVAGGLAIAAIYTAILNSRMKNVKPQEDASGYMEKDSYELTKKQDVFLYSQVTKREIPGKDPRKSTPGLGNSSDRTTTHVSRGGQRHGGRSGKF